MMRTSWAPTAVAVVVCMAWGGSSALAQGPSSGPAPQPSVMQGPAHVTGTYVADGIACHQDGSCGFQGDALTNDPRLLGCYALQPTGGATTGTWGTLTVHRRCGGDRGLPSEEDPVAWVGEWFTAGERAMQAVDADVASLYPVDAIWLHGAGDNAGLGAVLRIDRSTDAAAWRIEGWIFPSPGSLAIASDLGGTDASSVVPSPGPSAAPAASPGGPAGTSEVALLPVSELPDDSTHTLDDVVTFEQVVSLEILEAWRGWSELTQPLGDGQTRYTFLVRFRHDASRPDLTGYYYFTAFSMRDPDGFEYSLLAADVVRQPMLQFGELAAGEAAQGWLTFVGPADVPFVDLVYLPVADDRVVFRVGIP